ncbi:ankyrin repeat-containing domain protein [Trichoderma austrokoningii]
MSGAEALGVAAAAEQFVEAAFKVAKFVKAVVEQIQDAPDRIRQEAGRIESLASLAAQIKTTKSLQSEDVANIVTRCESCLRELQEVLEKITFEHNDSLRKKTWKAICGLQEEAVMKLFTVLHHEYSTLGAWINLHTAAVVEAVQTTLDNLDLRGQPADLDKKCLQDLFITDPDMDRAKLITSKGDIKEFVDWIASDGGLLWISGGPGLGKTMLSIYLTEYLSSYFRPLEDDKYHYATFFFCDAKDNTRNSSVAIQKGDLIEHIRPIYEVQNKQIFQQSSFETVWNMFLKMTNAIRDSPVTCILDGLDECEQESLQDLLNKLKKITSTSPRLKVMVLSREYPTWLSASLSQFSRIRLDPDAKSEVSDGLDLYISARVAELSKSNNYPAKLTDHVKKTLKDKSAGTYLWISFVVKDLQKVQVSEVEEILDQLPEGLHPLYERILEQIDLVHRGLALDILRWCTFAVRPLTLTELASALKIKSTDLLDREAILRGKLIHCGHFLGILNNVISLVHQSAYDFLTRRVASHDDKIPWFSLSSVEMEQSTLASACIAYFHDAFDQDEGIFQREHEGIRWPRYQRWPRYPFFDYAARQWHKHFSHAHQHGIKVLKEYSEFFFGNSPVWKHWTRVILGGDDNRELLSVAAELGLTVVVRRILERKRHSLYWKHLFAKTVKKKALYRASEKGHLPIVKLLVNNGVPVDCEEERWAPLRIAAMFGHLEVAAFLLTHGANINGVNGEISPLSGALWNERYEVAKWLLEWSAKKTITTSENTLNVNCRHWGNSTPLHLAVQKDSIEIIQLLLDHPGIDVKPVDEYGFSPMHIALFQRQSDIVQCLVQNGHVPLPEPDERWAWGAIHIATVAWGSHGDNSLLRLIIEELGVDPQFRTSKVRHPDDKWHTHQHLSISIRHEPYKTGLATANPKRSRAVLSNEMIYRSSMREHDSCYETALSVSAQTGNESAMTYLLSCCNIDANTSCRGCDDATALHVAAQSLQFGVVDMLISKWKANVNCVDRHQRTPLHLVVSAMHSPKANIAKASRVIQMLVETGAQRSAMDVSGKTPRDLFEDMSQERKEKLRIHLEKLLEPE